MPFHASLSSHSDLTAALDEVLADFPEAVSSPDLVVAFFSPHHLEGASEIAVTIRDRLAPRCLLGCVGESIIGNEREIEHAPALSLWAGKWSDSLSMTPFHMTLEKTPEGLSLLGRPDAITECDAESSALLLLGDPFSFPTDMFLDQTNEAAPGLPILGGMASGINGPEQARLLLDDKVVPRGAVGVLLGGSLGLRTIVSQGCRPIGKPYVITKAQDNLIVELGGHTPLEQLQQLWGELDEKDQRLFQQGLHIGRVTNEYQETFERGDFLVRNVVGLEKETGSLAITDHVRVGQTVQFHVRDADSADEDLRALLRLERDPHEKTPAGALVFSCNGRGSRLFSEPNHDAGAIRDEAGAIPLAGFFAMGELGPIGGKNFIHGFTASVALFEE